MVGGHGYRHGIRAAAVHLPARAHRGRSRHPDGRAAAPLLAPRGPRRRRRSHSPRDPRPRRGPGPLSRWRRPRRSRARALRAPRDHALLRQGGGARGPLLLSRLALRRRGPLPGAAVRAGRWTAPQPRAPAVVPRAGALRLDLRVHGPARAQARPAALRGPGSPRRGRVRGRRRHQHRQRRGRHRAVQLAAALRERDGSLSRPHPARHLQRHAVHRGDVTHAAGDLGLHRARREVAPAAGGRGRQDHAPHHRGGAADPAGGGQPRSSAASAASRASAGRYPSTTRTTASIRRGVCARRACSCRAAPAPPPIASAGPR